MLSQHPPLQMAKRVFPGGFTEQQIPGDVLGSLRSLSCVGSAAYSRSTVSSSLPRVGRVQEVDIESQIASFLT